MIRSIVVASALFVSTLTAVKAQTTAVMEVTPESFVNTVASSNAFEIQSSELALQKATNPKLTEFANQMIADHTKAAENLKAAADGQPVPDQLAPKHAGMIALLEKAEGSEFDMLYTDMQAGAHAEAVSLFSNFASNGTDPELKAFAAETLPTLEAHKQHIDQIAANP
ncbi:DUF4142 domain-containing protein [Cypionkella sp.]|uniref:DUF4142 domain-containing protein n=1 Tax=Cypionkella sp. TaxID=2811411 RepID=UPI0026298AF7|nr:DUF4142 domain-containing protein [Cypionkella sp.]MDB5665758.1 hypothetical protein [Cypionkella sp.]